MTAAASADYNRTIYSCFGAYIIQAIVNNFAPLLFLTFQDSYGLPLTAITMLVSFNFGIQLLTDFLSSIVVDRIGVRTSMILAHLMAGAGLICLGILPELLPVPFAGLLISVAIYAAGGGLIEVLASPVVESCPTDNKEKAMSLLHSFYCWGHAGVIIISTLYFRLVGISAWKYLAFAYGIFSLLNGISFFTAPMAPFVEEGEEGLSWRDLFTNRIFWLLMVIMVCSGASEQAVSQWASAFAEKALSISKTVGDLAGPLMFALMMGLSRLFYGKAGDRINLDRFMMISTLCCIGSYLLIVFSPTAVLSLIGCALCGLSVGILWPGTFSKAAAALKGGGTALFAFLALAGDVGCCSGPAVTGLVSGLFGDDLKTGICAAIVFPVLLLISLIIFKGRNSKGA